MCDKDSFAQPNTSSAGLGQNEKDWLLLVRLHCLSYEHNHAEGWDNAISHAEVSYGVEDGPAIASRIAVLIRAMRAERRGGFGYLSPHCPSCRLQVTEDERQLIALMQAGLRGDRAAIAEAAAALARRSEAPVLTGAATRFGSSIAAAMGLQERTSAPSLRLH
jgi:hypothetical protein